MSTSHWRILCATTLVLCCSAAPGAPKKAATVAKRDIKFITCQVCEHAVEQAWAQAKAVRKATKRPDEDAFVDIAEQLCDWKKAQGAWLTSVDIKQSWDRLSVMVRGEPGHCKEECRTAAAACRAAIAEHDLDLAEVLYNRKTRKLRTLQKWACKTWSGVCNKGKTPKVPETYERDDEVFKPKSKADVEMDALMAQLNAAGMGGMSVFNREEIGEMEASGEL
jgi:hypothetical protein